MNNDGTKSAANVVYMLVEGDSLMRTSALPLGVHVFSKGTCCKSAYFLVTHVQFLNYSYIRCVARQILSLCKPEVLRCRHVGYS